MHAGPRRIARSTTLWQRRVYSKNRFHLEKYRHEFKAGNVYFNRTITGALVGVQPFGGFGLSGTDSKAGGPDYLPLHMLARTVVERF